MTTNPPFFSIITVTRNHLDGLRRTRASVTSQTCSDYEWIIVDGASTDGTAAFLPHCPATIISEPDNGIYDAMNKGLEGTCGQYVIFMNAGDCFAASGTLGTIQEEAARINPDFIYGDALETLPSGQLVYKKSRHYHHASHGMITHHQSMLYRRDIMGDLRYDPGYKIAADFDFTARFLEKTSKMMQCRFPICVFEPGGTSQRHVWQGRCEQFRARRLHGLPLWRNGLAFMGQSAMWGLRRAVPALYWHLKARG
jgi:putative colanic acid biosynthesis glycosyltransferase